MSKIKDFPYLIIGGTTKSATTSLFDYLADHPEISGSTLKETRFFLDSDYPVPPLSNHWEDGLEKYNDFFKLDSPNKTILRLESTPDYLYSTGTPNKIKECLPNYKIVFILREPISRLRSWYRFAKQIEGIPETMTFEEYVSQQLQGSHFATAKQQRRDLQKKDKSRLQIPPTYYLSALEHGRYSLYLKYYFDILGREKIYVMFFEELSKNPTAVLNSICTWVGIDPTFYADYEFKISNRTRTMKNLKLNVVYAKLRRSIRRYTHSTPIHVIMQKMRQLLYPVYLSLNTTSDEKVVISPEIKKSLDDYYKEEFEHLEALLGRSLPW